jgi:hypothetical protein
MRSSRLRVAPGCRSNGVMESSAVLFPLRVILVFRDIIHVLITFFVTFDYL